jgi:hypothetical protein
LFVRKLEHLGLLGGVCLRMHTLEVCGVYQWPVPLMCIESPFISGKSAGDPPGESLAAARISPQWSLYFPPEGSSGFEAAVTLQGVQRVCVKYRGAYVSSLCGRISVDALTAWRFPSGWLPSLRGRTCLLTRPHAGRSSASFTPWWSTGPLPDEWPLL